MSSMAQPRDRAPSNATKDWKPQTTTPLRITKRDSPQPEGDDRIAPVLTPSRRRSVRNLADGARVSNSPFVLSQLSAKPAAFYGSPMRRVSGEKRPRTHSMSDQAENENPAVRKRRQSHVSELLGQKRPVTNSLFKSGRAAAEKPRRVSQETRQHHSTQPHAREQSPQTDQTESDSELAPPPPPKEWFGRASPHRGQSPSRPSLVSKRLHGPRMTRRHSRRKTVTFDEKCDVLEFDVDEDNSNPFDWVTDDDENYDHNDPMHLDGHPQDGDREYEGSRGPLGVHNADIEESFDSFQVGEDSITGLVDSMLEDARPRTPPHDEQALPDDLDTENGVPYGRSHHSERLAAAHQHHKDELQSEPVTISLPIHPATSTPSQSREGTPIMSTSPGSHVPLGRSTHSERLKAQKEHERLGMDGDLQQMPPSPSPAKPHTAHSHSRTTTESLIPRFALDFPKGFSTPSTSLDHVDPFSYPQLRDMSRPIEMGIDSTNRSLEESANFSIGNSEVSLSGLNFEIDESGPRSSTEESHGLPATSTPPTSPSNHPFMFTSHPNSSKDGRVSTPTKSSPLIDNPRTISPNQRSPFGGSPFARSPPSRNGSPLVRAGLSKGSSGSVVGDANGSPSGRSPRVTREAVQKKLEEQSSPLRDSASERLPESDSQLQLKRAVDSPTHTRANTPTSLRLAPKRIPPPKLAREPTHDGVVSLGSDSQLSGPPRPSLLSRSRSDDDVANAQCSSLANLSDMKSALDRLMADVAGEATLAPDGKGVVGLKIEAVTEGIQAGRFTVPASVPTPIEGEADESNHAIPMDVSGPHDYDAPMDAVPEASGRDGLSGGRPESLLQAAFLSPEPTGTLPVRPTSPQTHAKDAIRTREQLIKAMKQRRKEEEEPEDVSMDADTSVEFFTPPLRRISIKRPARRRSKSTGDAGEALESRGTRKRADTLMAGSSGGLLDSLGIDEEEDPLADSIDRELRKLKGSSSTKYHVRERPETIYAIAEGDKVSHMDSAGDVDAGKAWRTVRRPSDMNEYAKQIKELRAKDKSGKAYAKIFVKVLGVKNLIIPFPEQETAITCTLNNGVHYVTTPAVRLRQDCRIDQEFEILEQSKLEFSLTIKVRLDQHIKDQFKANSPPSRPPSTKIPSPPAAKGGFKFWGGGQKKAAKALSSPVFQKPPPHKLQENLARYLTSEGTLALAFVAFDDIAKRCDTRLFETSFPLLGRKTRASSEPQSLQVGELVMQFFRLPPLAGIPPETLPQSLEACHRGLETARWHKETFYEGTLTQNGGDCTSWRRRHIRIMGGSMIAYNDVTKKAIATIDLKKAVAVQDDQEPSVDVRSPDSGLSARSSRYVEHDGPSGMERSFRLIFSNKQEITFYADTNEEKARWLEVLRTLVGKINPSPLWAEVAWQRLEELQKRRSGSLPQPQEAPAPISSPPTELTRAISPLAAPQPRRAAKSRQG
ncbi:hypothetical protein BC835DRAFT_1335005 [Cytidiella melzeri]|nr:hypothetical protein BC835DRAFT_1335005 [Cytidiella melzeri]